MAHRRCKSFRTPVAKFGDGEIYMDECRSRIMANRPKPLKTVFTKDDVRVLCRRLQRRTLATFWDAGALLVKRFGDRAG
jgi:hypothetical protein